MKYKFTVLSGVLLIVIMGMGTLGCQQTSNNSTGHAGVRAGSRSGRAAKVSWSGTRPVEISDPKYQMVAASLNVPTGWKFAGAVARPPGCHDDGVASIEYTMLSPDGITAIATLPRETWGSSTSPRMQQSMAKSGCPSVAITSAAGFLINIAVPNMHPNAKIIGIFPPPAEIQSQLATEQANLRQQYPRQQYVVEGARVRVQYLRNGQPVEEMITAAINCTSGTWPPMWPERSPSRHTDCSTQYIGVVRAPQGHLDQLLAEPQLAAVIGSAHEKDDWFHRMVADKVEAGREALDAFNQRAGQILAQGQVEHNQLMTKAAVGRASIEQQGADSRAQAQNDQYARDQAARQTVNYAGDRQDFINPANGETINASSEYNHQWLSSDGSTLIQTDNHGLDPNGLVYPGQSWNELVPKQ